MVSLGNVFFCKVKGRGSGLEFIQKKNIVDDFCQAVAFGNNVAEEIFFNLRWHFVIIQQQLARRADSCDGSS